MPTNNALTREELSNTPVETIIQQYLSYYRVSTVVGASGQPAQNSIRDRERRVDDLAKTTGLEERLQNLLDGTGRFIDQDVKTRERISEGVLHEIAKEAYKALGTPVDNLSAPELVDMITRRLYDAPPDALVRFIADNPSGDFGDKGDNGLYRIMRPVLNLIDAESRNINLIEQHLRRPENLDPLRKEFGTVTGKDYTNATADEVLRDFREYTGIREAEQRFNRPTTYGVPKRHPKGT